jgi:hypothetical protein
MAGIFTVFEHYPILLPNGQAQHTQPGDTCQIYGACAIGRYHREYSGEWDEVCLTRTDGTILDPCYIPAAAIDLWS